MQPFFFRNSDKPLFGVYHAPARVPKRDCNVVLCYPMGHEYLQAHRAFRQLAVILSKKGFPVLRFDFFGCGDSGGASDQASLGQWCADISSAVEEMRGRTGAAKVCLVGYRLGGTLAARAGAEQQNVDALVLWDPITQGRDYLEELTLMHRSKVEKLGAKATFLRPDALSREILGYAYADQVLNELGLLDLAAFPGRPAERILVLESDEETRLKSLCEHFGELGTPCAYKYIPGPKIWKENINRIMVPVPILRFVGSWLAEVFV